ncbi:mechanosensitive ion channel [Blastopirellula sp. JC732]|uniref:Mechanosensitive ion channel n=1 Tax=Blastopirellula sediminis TaxID=2894196 RepID=A0A9X1SIW5_9BACT|nr:mechanosensitive ion channel domain-containing protein [Blastopirellula sediminis]MCC9605459.1 mechanosensitive ion channel [Blastopirellula sediminis]MCC9631241.1 mechanosensitive ion channel [Blastopirellula sediminis]
MFFPLLLAQAQNGAEKPVADNAGAIDVSQKASETLSDVQNWGNSAVVFLQDQGPEWILRIVTAILIFVVGRWISIWASGFLRRLMERGKVDQTLALFLSNIAYGFFLTLVIVATLNRLGIDTTSVAAVLAAAGLAVGLALQNSLSNFAAGVMIIFFRPFSAGDFIEAGGTSGIVEAVQIFHTQLKTPDNKMIIVPNSNITSANIINYSTNATRRFDLTIGCGYDDDLRAVKQFLIDLLNSDERVLKDPASEVRVTALADSSVNFVVRGWVKKEDFWAVTCDLTEQIKLGFDERGFSIPYPQSDVHVHQAAAT